MRKTVTPFRRSDAPGSNEQNQAPGWVALLFILLAATPSVYTATYSLSYSVLSYERDVSDALIFRTSVELLLNDQSPYRKELRNHHIARTRLQGELPPYDLQFAYPPNGLPLFLIYALGSPRTGYFCFVLIGTLSLLVATDLWARQISRRWVDHVLLVVAVGAFKATWFNALLGQTGSYLAATVILFALYYPRKPVLAGIVLGLMAFKPQYALVLAVLPIMERRWRIVVVSGVTFVGCSLASGLLFGFSLWGDFCQAIFQSNHTISDMCNWFGVVYTCLGHLPADIQKWSPLVLLAGLAILALIQRHLQKEVCSPRIAVGIFVAASSVISPNSHPYDLMIWLVPISLYARAWRLTPALPLIIVGVLFGEMPRNLMPVVSLLLAASLIVGRRATKPTPAAQASI